MLSWTVLVASKLSVGGEPELIKVLLITQAHYLDC